LTGAVGAVTLNCSTSGATGCTACGVNMSLVAGNSTNSYGGLSYCMINVTGASKLLAGLLSVVLVAIAGLF